MSNEGDERAGDVLGDGENGKHKAAVLWLTLHRCPKRVLPFPAADLTHAAALFSSPS